MLGHWRGLHNRNFFIFFFKNLKKNISLRSIRQYWYHTFKTFLDVSEKSRFSNLKFGQRLFFEKRPRIKWLVWEWRKKGIGRLIGRTNRRQWFVRDNVRTYVHRYVRKIMRGIGFNTYVNTKFGQRRLKSVTAVYTIFIFPCLQYDTHCKHIRCMNV